MNLPTESGTFYLKFLKILYMQINSSRSLNVGTQLACIHKYWTPDFLNISSLFCNRTQIKIISLKCQSFMHTSTNSSVRHHHGYDLCNIYFEIFVKASEWDLPLQWGTCLHESSLVHSPDPGVHVLLGVSTEVVRPHPRVLCLRANHRILVINICPHTCVNSLEEKKKEWKSDSSLHLFTPENELKNNSSDSLTVSWIWCELLHCHNVL